MSPTVEIENLHSLTLTEIEKENTKPLPIPKNDTDLSLTNIRKNLQVYWPKILNRILEDEGIQDLYDTSDYLRKVLEYNVPFGKQQRACMFIHMCLVLEPNMEQEHLDGMYEVAWILEILQASALMYDDIMDDSVTRRGKPCWHLEVGKSAINDAIYLENIVYKLLRIVKNHDKDDEHIRKYVDTIEFIHSIILKSTYGQGLDTRLPLSGSILHFKMDLYKKIVKYKTTLYIYYGPIGIAMILKNIMGPAELKIVDCITSLIGELFQIQDDYLDCFGDPKVTGKIGTDIQDGKCSWLIVKALELCTDEQKSILVENYGKKDYNSIENVKNVYYELDLEGVFFDYEDEAYELLNKVILKLPAHIPKSPFNSMVNAIYKRNK